MIQKKSPIQVGGFLFCSGAGGEGECGGVLANAWGSDIIGVLVRGARTDK